MKKSAIVAILIAFVFGLCGSFQQVAQAQCDGKSQCELLPNEMNSTKESINKLKERVQEEKAAGRKFYFVTCGRNNDEDEISQAMQSLAARKMTEEEAKQASAIVFIKFCSWCDLMPEDSSFAASDSHGCGRQRVTEIVYLPRYEPACQCHRMEPTPVSYEVDTKWDETRQCCVYQSQVDGEIHCVPKKEKQATTDQNETKSHSESKELDSGDK